LSPNHGTAYDLIGKKIASEKSLEKCFTIANKIFKNRNMNAKT